MSLRRFTILVSIGVVLALVVVWERALTIRNGIALNDMSVRRQDVGRENVRLYCKLQSLTKPEELLSKVERNGSPLAQPDSDSRMAIDKTSD